MLTYNSIILYKTNITSQLEMNSTNIDDASNTNNTNNNPRPVPPQRDQEPIDYVASARIYYKLIKRFEDPEKYNLDDDEKTMLKRTDPNSYQYYAEH